MNRKGLSQILYLIIAASVLMMAALSLVFAFQSGVTGSNQDAELQSCISTIEAACGTTSQGTINAPATCTRLETESGSGYDWGNGEVSCD